MLTQCTTHISWTIKVFDIIDAWCNHEDDGLFSELLKTELSLEIGFYIHITTIL